MRFFLCWLYFLSLFGATAQAPFSAVYAGANAYSAAHPEPFHLFKNAASLAWHQSAEAGFYGERRFNLSELFWGTIAATLPAGNSYFGLGVQSLGGEGFRQSRYLLAYAHALGAKAAAGASFGYQRANSQGYGASGALNFSAGAQIRVTNQLSVGINVANPTGFGKAQATENTALLEAGLGYDVSDAFSLTAIITKYTNEPIAVQAACQYWFAKKLLCRIGTETATSQFFIGAGFLWGAFRIDAVGSVHPHLGFTPGLQLIYHAKGKE